LDYASALSGVLPAGRGERGEDEKRRDVGAVF
jgi:hypothetical protein